jgi:hypothetical protein
MCTAGWVPTLGSGLFSSIAEGLGRPCTVNVYGITIQGLDKS